MRGSLGAEGKARVEGGGWKIGDEGRGIGKKRRMGGAGDEGERGRTVLAAALDVSGTFPKGKRKEGGSTRALCGG